MMGPSVNSVILYILIVMGPFINSEVLYILVVMGPSVNSEVLYIYVVMGPSVNSLIIYIFTIWAHSTIAGFYSGLENRCNVWKCWIDCDVALDSIEITLSTGGME